MTKILQFQFQTSTLIVNFNSTCYTFFKITIIIHENPSRDFYLLQMNSRRVIVNIENFGGDGFSLRFGSGFSQASRTIFAVVLSGNVTVEHRFAFKAELRCDLQTCSHDQQCLSARNLRQTERRTHTTAIRQTKKSFDSCSSFRLRVGQSVLLRFSSKKIEREVDDECTIQFYIVIYKIKSCNFI